MLLDTEQVQLGRRFRRAALHEKRRFDARLLSLQPDGVGQCMSRGTVAVGTLILEDSRRGGGSLNSNCDNPRGRKHESAGQADFA